MRILFEYSSILSVYRGHTAVFRAHFSRKSHRKAALCPQSAVMCFYGKRIILR